MYIYDYYIAVVIFYAHKHRDKNEMTDVSISLLSKYHSAVMKSRIHSNIIPSISFTTSDLQGHEGNVYI